MGRKTNRQKAKEAYEQYEKEYLETHSKNVVDNEYAIWAGLHCGAHLNITDTSNYFIASKLACALYSYNEGTTFYKTYISELYQVLPKEKVDAYVFGRFESKNDRIAMNWKYDELEFVAKYRL